MDKEQREARALMRKHGLPYVKALEMARANEASRKAQTVAPTSTRPPSAPKWDDETASQLATIKANTAQLEARVAPYVLLHDILNSVANGVSAPIPAVESLKR